VYVGVMKAVILSVNPAAQLVDLTHEVPPQDVRAGAFLLAQAMAWCPRGTVHLAVVDPGVGTARRAIAVESAGQFFVGPDNGLLSLAAKKISRAVILNIPRTASATFHGRDVFAPAAARLSLGEKLESLGRPAGRLLQLPKARGEIVWIDHFGNLITDLKTLKGELRAGDFRTRKLHRTYGEVGSGEPLALLGSHGFVEIAVRNGSAEKLLGISRGARVTTAR
jgi:S-adenosyl-L-methionine hydrolase (adenosine-forming)